MGQLEGSGETNMLKGMGMVWSEGHEQMQRFLVLELQL